MLSGITWLMGNNNLCKRTHILFSKQYCSETKTLPYPQKIAFYRHFIRERNVMLCQNLSYEHTDCNTPEIHLLPSNGFLKRCLSLCLKASNLFIDVKQTEKGSSDLVRYQPPHLVRRALFIWAVQPYKSSFTNSKAEKHHVVQSK